MALGVLAIQALALVADLLGFLGLPWFFRVMFWIPGVLICYLAWTIGLGAVFMTRFGTSDHGAAAAAPLPPAPPAPPATDGEELIVGDPGEGGVLVRDRRRRLGIPRYRKASGGLATGRGPLGS